MALARQFQIDMVANGKNYQDRLLGKENSVFQMPCLRPYLASNLGSKDWGMNYERHG